MVTPEPPVPPPHTTQVISSTSDLTPAGAAGYTKAIYATLVAFLGSLGTAFADGTVSGQEWIGIALTTVIAGGGVYGLANKVVPEVVEKPIA